MKSDRLKKLEKELKDLQEWMKLGLVPKKEIERHKEEIHLLEEKIAEEKERLQFLKETGETEEYISPKRAANKPAYADTPTISDVNAENTAEENTEMETETLEHETKEEEKEGAEVEEVEEEEEDPFSDRNRWRRGGIIDPDANEW